LRKLLLLVFAILAIVTAGCDNTVDLPPPTPQAGQITATIIDSVLPTLNVKVGSVVAFRNRDELPHTATADDESFTTGPIHENDLSGDVSFTRVGTFNYHCEFHPSMTATIRVME